MNDILSAWGKCVVHAKKKQGIPVDSFGFIKGKVLADARKSFGIVVRVSK